MVDSTDKGFISTKESLNFSFQNIDLYFHRQHFNKNVSDLIGSFFAVLELRLQGKDVRFQTTLYFPSLEMHQIK